MNTRKLIAVLMAALMIVFAFAGCGDAEKAKEAASSAAETISGAAESISNAVDEVLTGSDKEYVTGKGTLVVGITDFAPMDYKAEDGSWTGFDAELAEAFAAYLMRVGDNHESTGICVVNHFFERRSLLTRDGAHDNAPFLACECSLTVQERDAPVQLCRYCFSDLI